MLTHGICSSIQQALSVRAALSTSAREHLESCPACVKFRRGLDTVDELTRVDVIDEARDELRVRVAEVVDIAARVRIPTRSPSTFVRRRKLALFGAWAAILTCVAVGVLTLKPVGYPPPHSATVRMPAIDSAKWTQILAHTIGGPKGKPSSPFTIVEFGDFCSPQCGRMHDVIGKLSNSAPVALYFVNRPFPKLKDHEYAEVAAEAACSAAAYGKFWQMYDVLFDHQKRLEPERYAAYATQAGLDGAAVRNDVISGKYLAQVENSLCFCDSIDMTMTPAIVLHDNKTGENRVALGRTEIVRLLANAPWKVTAAHK